MGGIPFRRETLNNAVLIKNSFGKFGTGVIVAQKTNSGHKVFLMTNKHVLENDEKELCDYITVGFYLKQRLQNRPAVKPIKIMCKENGQKSTRLFYHPTEGVDVAGILISDLTRAHTDIAWSVLEDDLLLNKEIMKKEVIEVGEDVLVLGYPAGIFSRNNYLPVGKQGVIASVPYEELTVEIGGQMFTGKIILVDATLFGGSSGGPVFIKPRWKATKNEETGQQTMQIGEGLPPYLLGIQSSAIEIKEKVYLPASQEEDSIAKETSELAIEKDEDGEFFKLTKPIMLNLVFSADYFRDIFDECSKRFTAPSNEK